MALAAGTRLGPYEILALIGAGGMGEVYRAADTRLNRTVAIKTLPRHWADDPEMKQRVEREAQTIAALNHPHICTLHDIGNQDGLDFLVFEYLEGETLASRLERGPLPLDEALEITAEIADALDKAHERGVVHRDLKPSNVMLTKTGAKLLDFGLAKFRVQPERASSASMVPTRADVTTPGMIVGTVQYMSPEQVEGKDPDARADVFALGTVLYEMITGRKAFEGKSRAILIASILTADPDPMPQAPPALDHTVRRCLAKNPDDRWQTAHDLMLQVQWISGGEGEGAELAAATAAARKRERRLLMLAAILAFFGTVMAAPAVLYFRGPAAADEFRFRAPLAGLNSESIAVSPDGKNIAAVLQPDGSGPTSLYIRPVGSVTSRLVAGTEDASLPFWSPDSRFIGFVAGGKLKRVEASGGAPQQIAAGIQDFAGGTWNDANTIVFGSTKGLFRVSAEGGKPESVTKIEKDQTGHFWPYFLPDGRHYLYLAWSGESTTRALFAGTLDSKEQQRIGPMESNTAYAAPGYLVFHREATLFAQPFSAKKLMTTGDPVHIADGVAFSNATGRGSFDASQNGTLIYFQGDAATASGRAQILTTNAQYGWVNRTGQVLEGAGETGAFGDFDLSPDGKQIAVTRQESGTPGADIWVIDWQRAGVAHQLTRDPADDVNPVWLDDTRVAYTTYRKGNADIYVMNANGDGAETALLETPADEIVEAASRDGKYIAYLSGQSNDIYALPLTGEKKPFAVVPGSYQKNEPQFSPDGKWLAYTSNESGGIFQVYVVAFPKGDRKTPISKSGGGQPRWSPDGKLYYRALDNTIMVVDIKLTKGGEQIEPGIPTEAFNPQVNGTMTREPTRHQFSISPDGQRFLLRVPPGSVNRGGNVTGNRSAPQVPPNTAGFRGRGRGARGGLNGFTVVLNWTSAVQKAPK
jgi:eukaryotic-like serine/threonine-protein kinase